ncbi:hypothetical protein BH11PSE12_BH11PSE12_22130 [soil metagenome]
MPIKFSSTINASGLPIAAGKVGSSGEVPLTDAAKFEPTGKTNFSDYWLDTEAIALDTARGLFWVPAGWQKKPKVWPWSMRTRWRSVTTTILV